MIPKHSGRVAGVSTGELTEYREDYLYCYIHKI